MILKLHHSINEEFNQILKDLDIHYSFVDDCFVIPKGNSDSWDMSMFNLGRKYQELLMRKRAELQKIQEKEG